MSDEYRPRQDDQAPGQAPVPASGSYGPYPQYPATPPPPRSRKWLVWVIVAVLLLAGGCSALIVKGVRAVSKAGADASRIGEETLGKWRDGNHGALWDGGAPELQQTVSRERFTSFLAAMEEQVGKPRSWSMEGFVTNTNLAGGGPLRTTTITYRVTHEKGRTTTTIRVDGEERLLAININIGAD